MTIYLWYFLIPYALLSLVIFVMAWFNLYHIIRFSFSNSTSTINIIIYLLGLSIILITSLIGILQHDWSQAIVINLSLNA